jgi:hypothetical protein
MLSASTSPKCYPLNFGTYPISVLGWQCMFIPGSAWFPNSVLVRYKILRLEVEKHHFIFIIGPHVNKYMFQHVSGQYSPKRPWNFRVNNIFNENWLNPDEEDLARLSGLVLAFRSYYSVDQFGDQSWLCNESAVTPMVPHLQSSFHTPLACGLSCGRSDFILFLSTQ